MKNVVLALALLALGTAPAAAQQPWAEKLFGGVTSHDFGNVPHGAQVKYSFKVKNIYAVPLEFTDVRSRLHLWQAGRQPESPPAPASGHH